MKKKILLVGWGFPPNIDGGLDIHVKHLFEELLNLDVDVSLILPQENAPVRDNVISVETSGDMMQRARQLSSKVAEIAEDYNVIHTHDWLGAEAGFKAKKYSDASWISTMHSLSSGRTRDEAWEELEKLEEIGVLEADKSLAVSNKLADEIQQKYGRRPDVVHNGFSSPESSGRKVKESLGIDGEMLFFVGRHAEQKGIEHLLYGFKKFLEEGKAELVIGGDGHMRESLEEFAGMLGIAEKVHFVGFIPSDELGDFYREADLFVSPSINEPFGLTITEAIESGTPVVATESGASELLSSESIIESDPDSEKISEAIKRGFERDRKVEEESRSWGEMAEEIIEIYGSL